MKGRTPVLGVRPFASTGPRQAAAREVASCSLRCLRAVRVSGLDRSEQGRRPAARPEYDSARVGREERRVPVSETSSRVVYGALKQAGVGLVSALPETWLVHLIRMAEDDPEMILVRLAREEEGVGISAGAHFAGMRSALLMQNHGFFQSV